MRDRLVMDRDEKTGKWFIYDNATQSYIAYADTESECFEELILMSVFGISRQRGE